MLQRADGAPVARRHFDADTECAGIRAIADKAEFQLPVRVAAIVAAELQTNARAQNQISIAVRIKVCDDD